MDIHSDNPDHGFQFPGRFEITAMGSAAAKLESVLPQLLADAGLTVHLDSVRIRESAKGSYVSVAVAFHASSREDYEAAHNALRAHPEVKWTL